MSTLIIVLFDLFIILAGGFTIMCAVDNYRNKHYFLFGFDIFLAIQWVLILVKFALSVWGVEFNG